MHFVLLFLAYPVRINKSNLSESIFVIFPTPPLAHQQAQSLVQ